MDTRSHRTHQRSQPLADLNGDDALDLAVTTTDGYLRVYLSVVMTLIAEDSPNVAAQNMLRSPYPNPFNHSVANLSL